MKKAFLLWALLLATLPAWAQTQVFNPATGGSGGLGTVTGVTAGNSLATVPGTPGGAITTSGTLYPFTTINAQTGTSYTVLNSDCGKLVTLTNGSAIAVTLPQAGAASSFLAGCRVDLMNIGAGVATITPTVSTINGLTTYVLQQYQGVQLVSNGTNYVTIGAPPALAANGLVDPEQLPTATPTVIGGVKIGTCLEGTGSGNKVVGTTAICRTAGIAYVIGNGTDVVTTGVKGYLSIPFGCTISAANLRLDQSGSMVVDVWKLAYSASANPTVANTITASAKPTVTSTIASSDTTLTGWTTAIAAGDVLGFNVDSASTATRATLTLKCVRTGA